MRTAAAQLVVEAGAPYGRIIRNAWEAFKNIPVQADGCRTYFTHPTFYGPNDPAHRITPAVPRVHHRGRPDSDAGQSAILYHAYRGDRVVMERRGRCWTT